MSIKRINKTATTATAKAPVSRKAPATKPAPTQAPARKAPAKAVQAKAPAQPVQCECHVRIEALYGMTQTQQKQIDALVAQCETLERIIVAVQTAHVQAPARETAPAQPKAEKAPSVQAPARIEDTSFDAVFDATLDAIEANSAENFVNEKVAQASPASFRRFLRTAQNRTIKIAAKAKGLTIGALDAMLAEQFDA